MFEEGRLGGEDLEAPGTLGTLATVDVHAFVSAQVGELGVGLGAHLALEWLDTLVYVLVLFEA